MRAFLVTCSLALACSMPLSKALGECSRVTQLQRQTQLERETQLGTRVSKESTVTVLWTRADWERHVGRARYARALFHWPIAPCCAVWRPSWPR